MNNAYKIARTPFPFPYAQMTTVLLLAHWILTPALMCSWTEHWIWAFIWTFTPVLSFWCIDLIAVEIEMPFGADVNDLPTHELQASMNETLLLLINPRSGRVPELCDDAILDWHELEHTYVSLFHQHDGEERNAPLRCGENEDSTKDNANHSLGILSHAESFESAHIRQQPTLSIEDAIIEEDVGNEKETKRTLAVAPVSMPSENETKRTLAVAPVSMEASPAQSSAGAEPKQPNAAEPQITAQSLVQPVSPKDVAAPIPVSSPPASSDVGALGRKDAALRLQECTVESLQQISLQLRVLNEGVHIMRAIVALLEDATSPPEWSGSQLPLTAASPSAPSLPGFTSGSKRSSGICGRLRSSCSEQVTMKYDSV